MTAPSGLAARARRIVRRLRRLYPDADCALVHSNAFELLVATILSAQSTDQQVNRATPALFRRYPDPASLARAVPATLENSIRRIGLFRSKTRSLIGLGQALVDEHRGQVPDRMEELVRLPGVGRKTANVVLGTWFGRPALAVDTHVKRLAARLALTSRDTDASRIELDLRQLVPREHWTFTGHALIRHGREVCLARRPACEDCGLRPDCPYPRR